GFTLLEVMITVVLMTSVGAALHSVGTTIRDRDQLSSAYAQDLSGLHRATRKLEADLRHDAAVARAVWRLDGTTLRRGDEVVARNIDAFEITQRGALSTVTVRLAPRVKAPGRREAVVRFAVRERPKGGA
ncbi:MAG: hypothetical protein QNJ98_16260, partial [Planctomycetota bacterium]|nr:hypothetical protein [Planctomycetota bacterium]